MYTKEQAIGVFDSGLGGISVLRELHKQMPQERYIYYGDSAYAPYGEKSREEIVQRCEGIVRFFCEQGVKAIVIACNTATSAYVEELRRKYPQLIVIGMEPALKLAVDGYAHQQVLVMATRFTLREQKFERLVARYADEHTILRLPCPKLVELIEDDLLEDEGKVEQVLREYLMKYEVEKLNSIVLGCTHFVFFKDALRRLCPSNVRIIDGNTGTVRHVKEQLQQRHLLCDKEQLGSISLHNSMQDERMLILSQKLLNSTKGA